MKMDKYKAFLAAAASGKFYEAAEELYITPATISKHISALENELGVELFERTSHGVTLTKEGETRLPIIAQIVDSYEAILSPEVNEDKVLKIMTIPPPSRFGLAEIITDFSKEYPDIHLEIEEGRGITKAVAAGECELGLVGTKYIDHDILSCITIKTGRIAAIMHKDHRLAKRKSISLKELEHEDFILPNPEVGVYQVYIDYCKICGFLPHIKQMAYRDDSVLFYVSNKQGVSLFVQEMLGLFNYNDIVLVPLEEEFYRMGALIKNKNRALSPSSAAFWSFMRRRNKQ